MRIRGGHAIGIREVRFGAALDEQTRRGIPAGVAARISAVVPNLSFGSTVSLLIKYDNSPACTEPDPAGLVFKDY